MTLLLNPHVEMKRPISLKLDKGASLLTFHRGASYMSQVGHGIPQAPFWDPPKELHVKLSGLLSEQQKIELDTLITRNATNYHRLYINY